MKVLMLNGSPKANGNTYTALLEIGRQLEKEGIEYEIVQMGGKPVRDCIGCNGCAGKGQCVFGDDMVNEVIANLTTEQIGELQFVEDTVNGLVGLRQVAPGSREVNAAFQEKYYVHRTQGAETWWNYDQIKAVAETEDYFALLLGKSQGQVYDKKGFSWGTPEDFRTLIQQKTGLRVQKVR